MRLGQHLVKTRFEKVAQSFDKPVSLVGAARLLCGGPTPSDDQIARVFKLMKCGVLPARDGGPDPMKWSTTESALAEFMAQRQLQRSAAKPGSQPTLSNDKDGGPSRSRQRDKSGPLQQVYRDIWRDYFLAVILRRRTADRSPGFQRAVLAGQTLLLLLLIGTVMVSLRQINSLTPLPMEHQAVERWIEAHTDDFAIERWIDNRPAADGEGRIVCVKYRYRKSSRRWIQTERTFRVVGETVVEIPLED